MNNFQSHASRFTQAAALVGFSLALLCESASPQPLGYWDERFSFPGANGSVNAIAVSGPEIYLAGSFGVLEYGKPNRLVIWNALDQAWQSLGNTDLSYNLSRADVILEHRSEIYLGGEFRVDNKYYLVVKWNRLTQTLTPLGGEMSGNLKVYDMAIMAGEIYVVTSLREPYWETSNQVKKWDGQKWSVIGTSRGKHPRMGSSITALATKGHELYVGGSFNYIDSVHASSIAKWDGVSWSALAGGLKRRDYYNAWSTAEVIDIAVQGENLYVGGDFDKAGTKLTSNIAKWNGRAWQTLGEGIAQRVEVLAVSPEQEVYVGGSLHINNYSPLGLLRKWDGKQWSDLGRGVNGPVRALHLRGNNLYVGGEFGVAGEVVSRNLARWNTLSNTWFVIGGVHGKGASGEINAMALFKDDLYVGGDFTAIGVRRIQGLMRWDGKHWFKVGDGIIGSIQAIAIKNRHEIYVSGRFSLHENQRQDRIAKWDGKTWIELGEAPSSYAQMLAVCGNDVYFATDRAVFKWDGQKWNIFAQTSHSDRQPRVHAMITHNNALYVGGHFESLGDPAAPIANLAKWNGRTWSEVGAKIHDTVTDIEAFGNELYITGTFYQIGNLPIIDGVAKWDGQNWIALAAPKATSRNMTMPRLAINNSGVFGVGSNSLYKLHEGRWTSLGYCKGPFDDNRNPTTIQWINALVARNEEVYIGGYFLSVHGGKSNARSYNIALWHSSPHGLAASTASSNDFVESAEEQNTAADVPADFLLAQNYPNPFNAATIISYGLPETRQVELAVYNLSGERVATLVHGLQEAGSHQARFAGDHLPSGTYFYRLIAGEFQQTRKLLLVK